MASKFQNLKCNSDIHVNNTNFEVLVGEVIMWPHANNIPSGFLSCNGQTYNTTTYSELYSVIGSLYGSSLPNLNSGTDLILGNSNMSNNSTTLTSVSVNNPMTGGNNKFNTQDITDHTHTFSFVSNAVGYNYTATHSSTINNLKFNMIKRNFGNSANSTAHDDGGNRSITSAKSNHTHNVLYNGNSNFSTTTKLTATYSLPKYTTATYNISDYSGAAAANQSNYEAFKFNIHFIIYAGV